MIHDGKKVVHYDTTSPPFAAALEAGLPEPVRGRPALTVLLAVPVLVVTFVVSYVVVGLVS